MAGICTRTTDLAAVRFRWQHYRPDRIMYFIDARQALYLRQFFAVARQAGFAPAECSLEHHAFGTIMGRDKRPFKTRSGDVVKLADLLDEAVRRARDLVTAKNPELEAGRSGIASPASSGSARSSTRMSQSTGRAIMSSIGMRC